MVSSTISGLAQNQVDRTGGQEKHQPQAGLGDEVCEYQITPPKQKTHWGVFYQLP